MVLRLTEIAPWMLQALQQKKVGHFRECLALVGLPGVKIMGESPCMAFVFSGWLVNSYAYIYIYVMIYYIIRLEHPKFHSFTPIKALLGMQTTTSDHALRGFVGLWVCGFLIPYQASLTVGLNTIAG